MQTWGVQADGGYATVPELTTLVRMQAQQPQGLSQLANPPDEGNLGKGRGDQVTYLAVRNIATAGGKLTETQPIPKSKVTMVPASMFLFEYGNSLNWTEKLENLSRIDLTHPFMRALMDDLRKLENDAVYQEAITTKWKAVVNHASNNTISLTTNGTPSGVAQAEPQWAALMRLTKEARSHLIPPFDGQDYVYVTGPDAILNLQLDPVVRDLLKQDDGRALINGEVGRIAGLRLVEDLYSIDQTAGASAFNEGLLFGADAIQLQVGVPWEIRRQLDDFGRDIAVAYIGTMGWKKTWDQDIHQQEHIIHVTSA